MAKQVVRLKATPGNLKLAADPGNDKIESVPVKVVKETDGPVTLLQKLKAYYHTIITIVGAVLVLINEVTPLLNFIPGDGKQYVNAGIVFLTALANFLKNNETWVDNL